MRAPMSAVLVAAGLVLGGGVLAALHQNGGDQNPRNTVEGPVTTSPQASASVDAGPVPTTSGSVARPRGLTARAAYLQKVNEVCDQGQSELSALIGPSGKLLRPPDRRQLAGVNRVFAETSRRYVAVPRPRGDADIQRLAALLTTYRDASAVIARSFAARGALGPGLDQGFATLKSINDETRTRLLALGSESCADMLVAL